MVMIIKSNVTGSAILQPDGWDPSFNTEGLIYANIFGRGNMAANYAPGGGVANVGGSPMIEGEFAVLSPVNYIDTGLKTGSSQTLIAIAKDNPTTENSENRRFLISSQGPSGFAGKSLLLNINSSVLYMYSDYFYMVDGIEKNNYFSQALARENTSDVSFVFGRDYGNAIDVGDISVVQKKVIDGYPNTTKDYTYHVGTNGIDASNEGVIYIAAALIFNRAISDEEIKQVYSYFKDYYSRRGITI